MGLATWWSPVVGGLLRQPLQLGRVPSQIQRSWSRGFVKGMSFHHSIGDKDILQRRLVINQKYENVKSVVETGMTAELVQYIKHNSTITQRQPGEFFRRIRAKTIAENIIQRERCLNMVYNKPSDGGFAHPMDEYREPNAKPEKEYLILDVRSEEDYAACHIIGALNYPRRKLLHATNSFLPEMFAFKNRENKTIVLYDLEEEKTVGENVGNIVFEKGVENVAVLAGGLREFVQDHVDLIVGDCPVPIVPRDMRLQKRAEAASVARSETHRSTFSHKPKSLSNSLAKPRYK